MADKLKFVKELPVQRSGRRRKHEAYARQARQNPGMWGGPVSIHSSKRAAQNMAWQTTKGKRKTYESGFEAEAVAGKDGSYELWIRYVGDNEDVQTDDLEAAGLERDSDTN